MRTIGRTRARVRRVYGTEGYLREPSRFLSELGPRGLASGVASVPAAAQSNEEPISAAFVTGTATNDSAMEDEGRVTWEQTVEWSDPRLPPTLRADGACLNDDEAHVKALTDLLIRESGESLRKGGVDPRRTLERAKALVGREINQRGQSVFNC